MAPVARMIASAASVRPLSQRIENGRRPSSSAVDIFALDARADMLGLGAHLLHQPRPLDRLGEAGIVLDVGRDHQLAARLEAGEQERLQHGARGVDRRRVAGRPRADDDDPFMLNSGRRQFDPRIWAYVSRPGRRASETCPLYGGESSSTTAPFTPSSPVWERELRLPPILQSAVGSRRMTNSIRSSASSRQDSISVM